MLELNEKNVNDIYNKVHSNKKDKDHLLVSPFKPGLSPVYISASSLRKNIADVNDLACQLKVIQENKEVFRYNELSYAYNKIPWTYNQEAIDKLFCVLSANFVFAKPVVDYDSVLIVHNPCLDRLDKLPTMRLTEENVSKIMRAGIREDDSAESTIKIYSANDYPSIYFDIDILISAKKDIANMFGQTKVIHDQTPIFDMEDLAVLYDGSVWTKDPTYIKFLFYLISGCMLIRRTERRGPTQFRTIGTIAPTSFEEDRR